MKIKAEMMKMQRILQRINKTSLGSLKWDKILEKLLAIPTKNKKGNSSKKLRNNSLANFVQDSCSFLAHTKP